tara:strand:+ start:16514 stop:18199 length:1686 start_codon:yes stop_codon:yes gene_type:complete
VENNFKDLNFENKNLIFLPLGGSGEIGMNCNLYHFKDQWLVVDLGITFKDERVPSAEILMPNIDFLISIKKKIKAIILTHAHEDHIGAMPYLYKYLDDCPIYTTSFTASVLEKKFLNNNIHNKKINILEYEKNINIGEFNIEIVAMTHSIPEPNAIVIRTKKGNIFHTGDWKIDPTPLVGNPINVKKIQKISKEKIHAMICDSTNVFEKIPSGSENDVRNTLEKIFSEKKQGKIIISCFASNIARLDTIAQVARNNNRSCILLGRSLKRIYESALENNYLTKQKPFINEKDGKHISDENVVLICTGSQGEKRAALHKLINGDNKNFFINNNDLVIFSSREIPGNEQQINNIKNILRKINCKYIDDKSDMVHVSGHPSKQELAKMYDWVKPDILIPVHGEFQHLSEHFDFAKNSGIKNPILIENGDCVLLDNDENNKIVDKVFTSRNVLLGNRILPIERRLFDNSRIINNEGEILIVLILNLDDMLVVRPIISCLTIFDDKDVNEFEKIKNFIELFVSEQLLKSPNDEMFVDLLIKKIRNYIKKDYGIKPMVDLKIIRLQQK